VGSIRTAPEPARRKSNENLFILVHWRRPIYKTTIAGQCL